MGRFRFSLAALTAAVALVAPAAAAPSGESILNGESIMWRLDPPDGGAPSYVVGTIHAVDARLEPAIARAVERLEETGALVVETDLSDGAQLDVMAAMVLQGDRSLPDIIGADSFARLAEVAAQYGLPEFYLRNIAPWGAAMMISVPVEQMEAMAAGQPVFDQRLVDVAERRGLPVETLEPIMEQIAAFANHPEEDQVMMLEAALTLHPQLDALVDEMIGRYIADDLAGLAEIATREMEFADDALTQRVLDAVITDRNHRMAQRVLPLLEERPHLVAIGALHLPGEEGVLNLLVEEGWTVRPAP